MGAAPDRKYPLKQPANHKPPVPRWTLKLPDDVTQIYTLYVGIQNHGSAPDSTVNKVEQEIDTFLRSPPTIANAPSAIDTFRTTNGFDIKGTKVWVAYWTDGEAFIATDLELLDRWKQIGDNRNSIGLWLEVLITPIERLETNYSRLDHKPGLAQLPGAEQPSHNLTAYWGAGRDRLPASAQDFFEKPEITPGPEGIPKGIGEHLNGTNNYDNMCHIRSGQWWEKCDDAEREAYENDLQPTLMKGMHYLWSHPEETGTIGLRFLQNTNVEGEPIKETCGAGFHRNWADLERWSSKHPSHLAIFNGAMRHAKQFGEGRKLMTWHEVSVLKKDEARFEYVNCVPETGVIRYVELEREALT